MPNYGFRVYSVSLRETTRRQPRLWETDGWSYLSHVRHGLKLIEDAQAVSDDGTRPAPLSLWYGVRDLRDLESLPLSPMSHTHDKERLVGRLVSADYTARHALSLTIRTGYVGDYDDSISLTGDRSMRQEAAARDYRVELVAPQDSSEGLMAVEAIGRACPVHAVTCLLGLASRQVGWIDGPDPNGAPRLWWRLDTQQVSDPEFLEELLDADKAEVHLSKITYDHQGKKSKTDIRLIAALEEASKKGPFRQWLRLPAKERKERGVKGLFKIVEADSAGLEALELNDGYVRIGEGSRAAKIRLDDVVDKFTYQIGTQRPDNQKFRQAVHERMSVLDDTLNPD